MKVEAWRGVQRHFGLQRAPIKEFALQFRGGRASARSGRPLSVRLRFPHPDLRFLQSARHVWRHAAHRLMLRIEPARSDAPVVL
jgi:hypothetical protein